MAFELDDILKDDKKDINILPDLSKATCNSQEEFRQLLEHTIEFKIKPEKVKREDTKIRDKDFSWKATRKEVKALNENWMYGNPIPPDIRGLNLSELQQVAIDWRMLTPVRPKLRQEEEMFSRLVEMGKLEMKTQTRRRRSFTNPIIQSKNRVGICENSVQICGACGVEYCYGETCGDILYDSFIRVIVIVNQPQVKVSDNANAIIANMNQSKKKKKKKIKNKNKTKKSKNLLVYSRIGKSTNTDMQNKNNKGKRENDDESITKPVKQFKRKCTKYKKRSK